MEKKEEIAQDIKLMAVKFLNKNTNNNNNNEDKTNNNNQPASAVDRSSSTVVGGSSGGGGGGSGGGGGGGSGGGSGGGDGRFDPVRVSVRNVLRDSLTKRLLELWLLLFLSNHYFPSIIHPPTYQIHQTTPPLPPPPQGQQQRRCDGVFHGDQVSGDGAGTATALLPPGSQPPLQE